MGGTLTWLERHDEEIRHPSEVAWLRKALNESGYDASDADIQWAYSEWSEEYYAAGWYLIPRKSSEFKTRCIAAIQERLKPTP